MADTFTTRCRAEKPEVNANEATWGDELNANTFDMFDEAIHGVVSVSVTSGNVTLSTNNGTADEARNPVIILTGTPGTTRTVTFPDIEGVHWVRNNSDSTATLTAGAGTTVSLPTLHSAKIYTDGATNAAAILIVPNSATIVGTTATQTLTNKTLTAAILGGTTDVSGGQLAFPASQSASADANTLDDYEEGTFTPILEFGGGSTGITYGTQTGFYTKIGQRVLGEINIVLTAKGSSAGNAVVTGLPFTVGNAGPPAVRQVLIDLNTAGGYSSVSGILSSTSISLVEVGDNIVASFLTDADFQDTSELKFSFSYRV